jgi:hypothetical protein
MIAAIFIVVVVLPALSGLCSIGFWLLALFLGSSK